MIEEYDIFVQISEDGRGVPGISEMLKLTRIHNAISSVAGMRRYIYVLIFLHIQVKKTLLCKTQLQFETFLCKN